MWNSACGAKEKCEITLNCPFFYIFYTIPGLKIATAMVANVTTLATRFLYDLDLN